MRVLDILKKHWLFANLKKCQFYKDEVCFLGYITLAQRVRIEDKQIEAMKNWPKLTLVKDIQVFIGFANFYQRFIQGFNKIVALLTFLLKTTGLSESIPKAFKANDDKIFGNSSSKANGTVVNLSKNKKSRKSTCISNIGAMKKPNFLTSNAKKAFNYLQLAFIKALILQHFDSKSHIWIETDILGYAIGEVLNQLNLDSNVLLNDSNSNKSGFGQ